MSCNCNKKQPKIIQTSPTQEYIPKHEYFEDYTDLEKQVVAENLGVSNGCANIVNYPDHEDIEEVMQDSLPVLKFADKVFDPENYSGMGRKFLRKNIQRTANLPGVCGAQYINKLTQEMFQDDKGNPLTNTIFIVQYDYDLGGDTVVIPEDSVLFFFGGSFQNGTIVFNNTAIYPQAANFEDLFGCYTKGPVKVGQIAFSGGEIKYWDGRNWWVLGKSYEHPGNNCTNVYFRYSYDTDNGTQDKECKVPLPYRGSTPMYKLYKNGEVSVPTDIINKIVLLVDDAVTTPSWTPEDCTINGIEYSKTTIPNGKLVQIKYIYNADLTIV